MSTKLKVVLCWHMHQPAYFADGQYQLPWVYLHAIKDYVDMAAHLEAQPRAQAVINFSPILLEQIDDYAQQVEEYLNQGTPIRDPVLASVCGPLPHDSEGRWQFIKKCPEGGDLSRIVERFKPYQRIKQIISTLEEFKSRSGKEAIDYLDEQFFVDLMIWRHLGWLGETVRRNNPQVQNLINKAEKFSAEDRRQLLTIIGELLSGIIPRYRSLENRGQIELSMNPYTHPMIPLLLDMQSAKQADDFNLPNMTAYHEDTRIRWQIETGFAIFKKYFGIKPKGCWPPEGGICEKTVRLLEEYGIDWVASDEQILSKSGVSNYQFIPYQLPNSSICCFFRHHHLSNKIAFEFKNEGAGEAVGVITRQLEEIARATDREQIVTIILDGENSWEHFPENAYYFLHDLYAALIDRADIELTTLAQGCKMKPEQLPTLMAGSWTNTSFSQWVGDKTRKAEWELLNAAKGCLDEKRPTLSAEQYQAAERQLAICEGSDWFWWMDDLTSSMVKLYHQHLRELYRLLGENPPDF
jgi:alpha-amylase/alpha-mannosidase (GH57 family)